MVPVAKAEKGIRGPCIKLLSRATTAVVNACLLSRLPKYSAFTVYMV